MLSTNALKEVYEKAGGKENSTAAYFPPLTLQVVQIKAIGTTAGVQRYRVIVSDGINVVQGMLGVSVSNVNEIKRNSIVKVEEYSPNEMKGKKIFVIMKCSLVRHEDDKIGNPVSLDSKGDTDQIMTESPSADNTANKTAASAPAVSKKSSRPASLGTGAIYPIEAISPYQSKWIIKARITNKSEIREYHNNKGEGKLFNATLIDESGEIRMTGFKNEVDRFYDLLKEGHVYYVSRCRVNMAKKQFSNVQNDYELMLERDSIIEPCDDDSVDVPQAKFNFTTLEKLTESPSDAVVDVIGILKDVYEVNQITAKSSGRPYDKRDIVLVDSSNFSVRCTLWGKAATQFNTPKESVIALKGAKIADFNGRNLSMLASSSLIADPDIPESHRLKGWFDAKGRNEMFNTIQIDKAVSAGTNDRNATRITIAEVKTNNLGMTEKVDYFTIKGTISYIRKENVAYPACINEGCNKKVIEATDGTWRCEKCDISMDKPRYRYIILMSVADYTEQIWISGFDDCGQLVVGMTADELTSLKDESESQYNQALVNASGREYIFRCRAKQDSFNDQTRVRYQAVTVTALNYIEEANLLLEKIKLYED